MCRGRDAQCVGSVAEGCLRQPGRAAARLPQPGNTSGFSARILPPRRSAPVELELPPLDTQKDIALAIAAVGKAVALGEVTPAEAVELAHMFEIAIRAVEKREREYQGHHPCGTRPPSAASLPAEEAAADPDGMAVAPAAP